MPKIPRPLSPPDSELEGSQASIQTANHESEPEPEPSPDEPYFPGIDQEEQLIALDDLLDQLMAGERDALLAPATTPEAVPPPAPGTPAKGPLGAEGVEEVQEALSEFLNSPYRSLGQEQVEGTEYRSLGTAEETNYRSLGTGQTAAPYRSLGPALDASPMSIVEGPAASAADMAECRRACWKQLILAFGTDLAREGGEESDSEEERA